MCSKTAPENGWMWFRAEPQADPIGLQVWHQSEALGPGLDKFKFRKQLKKLKQELKANEPVSLDFLEKNPDVRKKEFEKLIPQRESTRSPSCLAKDSQRKA